MCTPVFDQYCKDSFTPPESCSEEDVFLAVSKSRKLLLQIIGYCLSDCTGAKAAFVLRGKSDSGKSVILDFLTRLLGDDAVSAVPLHDLGEKFELIDLMGKKINICAEVKDGKMSAKALAKFKQATGGDLMRDAHKSKDGVAFRASCKFIYAGNALPEISGDPDSVAAFANRLRILAFPNSIARDKRDPKLNEKLWEERDGIVTLAIRELRDLRTSNFMFAESEISKQYLDCYKQDGDVLRAFLREQCICSADKYERTSDLFTAYTSFCAQKKVKALGKSAFYKEIGSIQGVTKAKKRIGSQQPWVFTGIALKKSG